MLDVILGLYAMVLQERDGSTKMLYDLITTHYARVFPREVRLLYAFTCTRMSSIPRPCVCLSALALPLAAVL